jgi:hypothetical protein
MSRIGQDGFTVTIYAPLKTGESLVRRIEKYSSYSHKIDAFGGFVSAEITFQATLADLQEWYESGLMRRMVNDDPSGVNWEGFVNEITLAYGARSITIGPAVDIANRVVVTYTPIILTGGIIVKGGQTITAGANDTVSQSKYGIFPRIVNAGEVTDVDAYIIRDAYLKDMSFPQKSETLDASGAGDLSISLKLLGYSQLLANIPISNTSTTMTPFNQMVANIVAAEPNGYASTDFSHMSANAQTGSPLQDGSKTAIDLIKGICSIGDVFANRWTFGLYENRNIYYSAIPTFESYSYKLSVGIRSLTRYPSGSRIPPWAVRPAQWLRYTDFTLTDKSSASGLAADPQLVFIESVDFRAPFSLTLNGGRTNTLSQKLARFGLESR